MITIKKLTKWFLILTIGGGDLKKYGHRINKETLEMNYIPNNNSGIGFTTCEEISEKVFYGKIKTAKKISQIKIGSR